MWRCSEWRCPVGRCGPRLVRQQHVQEVERGAGVAGGGGDRGDEPVGGRAPVLPPDEGPAGQHRRVGREVAPALRHRRQLRGEAVRQHRLQVDDRQVAQHARQPGARAGSIGRAQGGGAQLGERLVDVEPVARPQQGEQVGRVIVRRRQVPRSRVVAGDDGGQGAIGEGGHRARVAEPSGFAGQRGKARIEPAVDPARRRPAGRSAATGRTRRRPPAADRRRRSPPAGGRHRAAPPAPRSPVAAGRPRARRAPPARGNVANRRAVDERA